MLGEARVGACRRAAPAPITEPAPGGATTTGPRRQLSLLLAALLVAPLAVSAVRMVFAIGASYAPVQDHAVIELNVRDVGHHAVLVGLPSRFGWFHPGPLIFYLLAAPYRLLGSRSIGMQLGALAINAAAIVVCVVVARRRGGTAVVMCSAVCIALFMRSIGADFLRNPWTPYVAVLPLLALVYLAWAAADGDVWMLPCAVGVASFVVQTHIGFTPVAASLVAWALAVSGVRTIRSRHAERRAPLLRPVVVSVVTAVVLWTPPLYGQLFTSDHNLSALVRYFRHAGPGVGWRTAWRVVGVQLGARPEWLVGARPRFGGFTQMTSGFAVPWLLVLGAGAGCVAVALRHRPLGMLVSTLAVATLSAIYAVSAITGGLFLYLVRWTWVIGVAWAVAVAWAACLVCRAALDRRPATSRAVARVAGIVSFSVLVVLATAVSVGAVRSAGPQADDQRAVPSVARQILSNLPAGRGPVVFVGTQGGIDEPAVALQLERHGVPVRFADIFADGIPSRRAHTTRWRARLTMVDGPDATRPPRQGEIVVARFVQPYTSADVANARRSVRTLTRTLGPDAGLTRDAQAAVRVALTQPKRAVAVFAELRPPA